VPGALAALARAYRILPATVGVVGLCAATTVTGARSVGLGGVPVRALWFLMLGVAVFGTLPLSGAFGALEGTFGRSTTSRLLRGGWHAAVVAGAAALATRESVDRALTVWFVLLSALGCACACVRAEAVSLVLLAVGGGTILIDHLVQYYPISQVMARVEPWSGALVYLVGLGLYVLVPAVVPVRPRHRDF
jgi:hypothetical protein